MFRSNILSNQYHLQMTCDLISSCHFFDSAYKQIFHPLLPCFILIKFLFHEKTNYRINNLLYQNNNMSDEISNKFNRTPFRIYFSLFAE